MTNFTEYPGFKCEQDQMGHIDRTLGGFSSIEHGGFLNGWLSDYHHKFQVYLFLITAQYEKKKNTQMFCFQKMH